MACNWLPHNLREVAQAIFDYIDGKDPSIPAPDFPTGGLIINGEEVPNIIKNGHGSVKIRGQYKIENNKIIFYEIPYGTNTEALMTEIGSLSDNKTIEGISNIRDESNLKGIRLVIECDKNTNLENVVQKLFLKTKLQTSISYNQIALVDKIPTDLGLIDCIKIYLEHNENCLIKEINFDKEKAEARKEILEGLLKALEDIDNIISLIKKSESSSKAKENLIKRYSFSESQAKAIVAMRLGSLANLEKIELQNEYADLIKELEKLNILLNSKEKRIEEIRARLDRIVQKYGDARRTQITNININKQEEKKIEIIPEEVVVAVNQNGEIKRIPIKNFKSQKASGKGKSTKGITTYAISTNTVDTIMLFSTYGKMYKLIVDKIPEGTNLSKGTHISNLIPVDSKEEIVAIAAEENKDFKYVLFFTKNGRVKKTDFKEYLEIKRTIGTQAIKIVPEDKLIDVFFIKNDLDIMIITKKAFSIKFNSSEVSPTGRATIGVKGIDLKDDNVIAAIAISNKESYLATFTENGLGKKTKIKEFPIQKRGGRGVLCHKVNDEEKLVDAILIDDKQNEVLLIGNPNSICISSESIPEQGRSTIGNIMIKSSSIISAINL